MYLKHPSTKRGSAVEVWRQIYEFPRYSISSEGRVRNDDTGRIMRLSENQYGIVYVGFMTRGDKQYKRSVAVLVAEAFLPDYDRPEPFDTPIHLDGDKANCRADNLIWRPFWFAVKYHRQFRTGYVHIRTPIEDERTGEQFRDSLEAAATFGLLDRDIRLAIEDGTTVWPTYQRFRIVDAPGRYEE